MLMQEKYGLVIFQSKGKNVCIGSLQVGTRAGYFSWQKIQSPFSNPEPGVWQFEGKFPANKNGGNLKVTEQIKLSKKESFELTLSCKILSPDEAKDTFLQFAINDYDGKKLVINEKGYPVPKADKFGWYYKTDDDPVIVIYPDAPEKKLRITVSDTAKIVCITAGNSKNIVIRVYPQNIQTELKLHLNFGK